MQEKKKERLKGSREREFARSNCTLPIHNLLWPNLALGRIEQNIGSFLIDSEEEEKPQKQTPPFLCKT